MIRTNSIPSKHWRAFQAAIAAISNSELWRTGSLQSGILIYGGRGVHVGSKTLPDIEKFRSLMLDFRQLTAQKDSANLNRTCNLALREGHLTAMEAEVIRQGRRAFNAVLDQHARFYTLPLGRKRPTIRWLLEAWFYGDWFHRDEDERSRRLDVEFISDADVSFVEIVPAVGEAISASLEIDAVIARLL